ncbi:hypothetical protein Btru_070403 [Bulinus truncatus]|nr:hypothetical protein Btru_070403 [Bulinus truncatus]
MDNNNPDNNTSSLPLTVRNISTTTAATYVVCSYEFESFEEMMTFKILKCYANPIMSVIGFSANVISVHLLRHRRLKKPTNILLLGLTLSDMMCQLMTMNYALILNFFGPNRKYLLFCGYQYGEAINYFLLASLCVVYFLGTWGQFVSSAIPCIISLERFLAVFRPMTFRRVITPRTASVSVVAAYVIWLPIPLYYMQLFEVTSIYSRTGVHVLKLIADARFYNSAEVYLDLNSYVATALTSWAPIALVSPRLHITRGQRKTGFTKEKTTVHLYQQAAVVSEDHSHPGVHLCRLYCDQSAALLRRGKPLYSRSL